VERDDAESAGERGRDPGQEDAMKFVLKSGFSYF
jgi:hypothetical protein